MSESPHITMSSKTASRSTPRSSHSHAHSSHTKRSSLKPTSTPSEPPPRIAASVGQALPPTSAALLRSPAVQDEVRTPSPNYFGLVVDPASDPRDSNLGPRTNWSPPTSSIQSFGNATPQHLPLDANPEFAAFRRRTEEGISFSLSHGNLSHFASTPGPNPRPRERQTSASTSRSNTTDDPPSPKSKPVRTHTPEPMDVDGAREVSQPRKLSSDVSFFDLPRQQSPANLNPFPNPPMQRNTSSRLDERHPRLSLPQNKADPPSPRLNLRGQPQQRADTLPPSLEEGPVMIGTSHLQDLLERLPASQLLLLDLRVFPQFSAARIKDALNLCIPTTLLKRPSFNLQKLKDTFASESEKLKFSKWVSAKYIVVYDAHSNEKKDAVSAVNTLKKFTNEGFKGHSFVLRGGFQAFAHDFPSYVDNRSSQEMQSSKINLSLGTGPEVAPVAGGCAMPASKTAANPFFSNIRQNQDLIGGVGQMDVKVPDELTVEAKNILPHWLLEASAKSDHGKIVSDKFLKLELDEQSRMTKALNAGVTYGTPKPGNKDVQIAGIEKGGKNRYNNIWPFEHARVRLQGREEGACDYVNASHVKSARSNKQYIASQGPLPATFEDFWSVIWDQDVRVIVMLTAESEGGQLKCHPYWTRREYGPLRLKPLSEKKVSLDNRRSRSSTKDGHDGTRRRAHTSTEKSAPQIPSTPETPHAVVRKFTLAHTSHPFSPMREITQIHYSSWPDFGAPANPAQLLGLVELCNSIQRASAAPTQSTRSDEPESNHNARPVLVHCSAGCGRTGTFCTIDSVIDMLKRQRKEIRSGVTPMEGMSSGHDDYMGHGAERDSEVIGDWIFDQDMDLVEKTVEDFREQRLSMVQSLRQYVLCYETVLEWIAQQRFGSKGIGRERRNS